jgi:hypothetical protein
MKLWARLEIFHLACSKKHFKGSENMQNYKIQPTAGQKIKILRKNKPFNVAKISHHSRPQARKHKHAFRCAHVRTHTYTHTHTESFSGIFAENLKEDLNRISKTCGK